MRAVPPEIDDLGRMVGATPRQRTWKVVVPAAMPGLMVGANQVIMLSLNIVIIASMIGAGGLGFEVLGALRRLDFGVGLEAGFAIVALAVVLDRLSQAIAVKLQSRPHRVRDGRSLLARHPYLFGAITLIIGTGLLGLVEASFQSFPVAWRLSTGDFWANIIAWINVNFFTQLEAFKDFLLLNFLIPLKRLVTSLPWLGVTGLLALAGFQLGGWRLALLTGSLSFLIAATGQWEKAMTTVYLCGIAVAGRGPDRHSHRHPRRREA